MDPRMFAIGGQIIGGYLMGQQQREARQEELKLKQAEHKMLLDAAKLKAQREQQEFDLKQKEYDLKANKQAIGAPLIQSLVQRFGQSHGLIGGSQGASGSPLRFGITFGPQSSAAEKQPQQMGLMEILSEINPVEAVLLKDLTEIDFPKALELHRSAQAERRLQSDSDYRRWNDELNRRMQAGQGTHMMRDVPGGGQSPVWLPTNPSAAARYGIGGGLGQAPPSLGPGGGPPQPFKLPESQKPIAPDDFSMWRHPGGQRPRQGMTPAEAQAQGFVRFTAPEVPKIDLLENGIDVLNEIENLMVAAGIPKSGESNRFSGGLMREGKAFFQAGREGRALAKLKSYIAANKATIARIGGEVGNLAEKEQEDVIAGLGQISDAGQKAWEQFELIKRKYLRIKARKFGLMPDKIDEAADMVFNPLTGQLEPAK